MPELDSIRLLLEQVHNANSSTSAAVTEAHEVVEQKADQFAGLGLEGVAALLGSTGDQLSAVSADLTTAGEAAEAAVTALSAVVDGTSVPDTIDALNTAEEKLKASQSSIKTADGHTNDALLLAQETEVEPVMTAVVNAISAIGQCSSLNDSAVAKTVEYRTKIQDTAGTQTSGTGESHGQTASSATTSSNPNSHPVFRQRARFGSSSSNDYKKTFFDEHPQTEGEVVVHHAVEQQIQKRYPGLVTDAQLHSYENLRGIPKGDVNRRVHLSAIRKSWNRFYKKHPNPTQQQLLDHATEIDNMYGAQFNPPVR